MLSQTAAIFMKRIIDLCCDAEDSRILFATFRFQYLDLWNVPHPRKCMFFYDDDNDDDWWHFIRNYERKTDLISTTINYYNENTFLGASIEQKWAITCFMLFLLDFINKLTGDFVVFFMLGKPSNIYGTSFYTYTKRHNHTSKMGTIIAHVPKDITIH